jgi:hypothetical protein
MLDRRSLEKVLAEAEARIRSAKAKATALTDSVLRRREDRPHFDATLLHCGMEPCDAHGDVHVGRRQHEQGGHDQVRIDEGAVS